MFYIRYWQKMDVKFKVSSNLKNLIWRELITDDYIAVFELVKNSYDAYAKNVTIIFENDKIIIKDDGKGMNENDIKNKRLFVWYSAKANKEEDIENDKSDSYRNRFKRNFAWAKWVWRFACDRLGQKLVIFSKKEKYDTCKLGVEWEKFEKDSKDEFVNIGAELDTWTFNDFKETKGTKIIISNLRNEWDRERKLALKKSLTKLINPFEDSEDLFNIEIISSEEIKTDKLVKNNYDKVNWIVENFIFESLWIKTTNIIVETKNNWKEISTKLEDRGDIIYKILETNEQYPEFYDKDIDINIRLFYLNRPAKVLFKKNMSINSVSFWSTFVYKNGFRIYPYWEEWDDSFKIDRRKSQWHSRYLWLRDLIGIIEINSDNNYFQETTSRDWWFIKNEITLELERFVKEFVLRRLEVYTVDTLDWTYNLQENEEVLRSDRKDKIVDLIDKMTKTKNIIKSWINEELILQKVKKEKEKWWISQAKKIAEKFWNKELAKELNKADKIVKTSIKQREEAEKEKELSLKENREIKKDKEEIERRLYFHQWVISEEKKDFLDYFHQIWINSETIKNTLKDLVEMIQEDESKEKIVWKIHKIYEIIGKTLVITKFATKANFKADSSEVEENLADFIRQYLENVVTLQWSSKISIKINWDIPSFMVRFIPIKIAIILDNMLNNSKKAFANNILINFIQKKNQLKIIFSDDWQWIKSDFNKIFEFWFTTTHWSGIGLNTVKKYMEEDFKWSIEVYSWKETYLKWAAFILTFNK